ncbi:MAG TPA: DNA-processing protein DprA [Lentimicrobium sp.]|nr:DNA-processing protein DprA [Lentimicrobium sp.]
MPEITADQLLYRIALTQLPGVGIANARKLISMTGSAEALFTEKKSALHKLTGLKESALTTLFDHKEILRRAEQECKFIERNKIRTYFFADSDYPVRLKQCIDSPIILYSKGNADLDSQYIVSIVGTRKATDYGKEVCRSLISGLSHLGVLIVSGLAYGIDTSAHRNALDAGLSTVGVLAHGLDMIYPEINISLAQRMLEQGGLVTEFISNTNPDRENFPMRNRIIAGLADATIVVEAGSKGGALITADIANSYNRDVFAVPGRISDVYSTGCTNLIKTNRAALVEKPEDILYLMGWDKEKQRKEPVQQKLFIQLEPDQEIIFNILQEYGECSIDKLCIESKMNAGKIATALLNLEFQGLIKSLPGKIYRLQR